MADTKKPTETKAQVFSRLGSARMNRVLGGLRGIEKLASKSYEYTPEQVAKLSAALDKGVQRVKDAFAGKKASDGGFEV